MKLNKPKVSLFMLKAGMDTQKALAQKAKMSEQGLSAALVRNCQLKTIRKIAAALGVDPADIVQEETK